MLTRHDYGDKFIDFQLTEGGFRLGLLPRKGLAKDVGANDEGKGHDGAWYSAIMRRPGTHCRHCWTRHEPQEPGTFWNRTSRTANGMPALATRPGTAGSSPAV
ncbi:hypothetical protein [Arthrobacter sp. JCM 19049]|uniref:hypothetical protein n=1 Tax=Arthrobacter sp. JCM 19049 TaxID=1460643 RepID=UPI0006D1074B|nr:hypothetical protein [Arthrobacter sp. JCM 19049]